MKSILGIVIGETSSPEEANKRAETMKNCPNLVALGTNSNMISSVYIVPAQKEWWLRYPETNPKETGLEKATAFVVRDVIYARDFSPMGPEKRVGTPPCGADCAICLLRERYGCDGCPATITTKKESSGAKTIKDK